VPGLGGYLAGLFFSFPLPADMLGYPIPQLEFLAIIAAVLVFKVALAGALAVLVTDSLTCQLVHTNNGAHTDQMMWLHLEYKRLVEDRPAEAKPIFAEVRHGYGETNPCADLTSRGRLVEFRELCEQLGVKPVRREVPPAFLDVLARFRTRFGQRFADPLAAAAYAGRKAGAGRPELTRPPPPGPPALRA